MTLLGFSGNKVIARTLHVMTHSHQVDLARLTFAYPHKNNRQYSYSLTVLGRVALDSECKVNAGKSLMGVRCLSSDSVDFARKCRNITAVPTTVPTAKQRKRTQSNTLKLQVLLFIVFHQITKEKQYAPGMSEQERSRR